MHIRDCSICGAEGCTRRLCILCKLRICASCWKNRACKEFLGGHRDRPMNVRRVMKRVERR